MTSIQGDSLTCRCEIGLVYYREACEAQVLAMVRVAVCDIATRVWWPASPAVRLATAVIGHAEGRAGCLAGSGAFCSVCQGG